MRIFVNLHKLQTERGNIISDEDEEETVSKKSKKKSKMVAQHKMKDSSMSDSSDSSSVKPSSPPKSRLAMLKRSSAKQKNAVPPPTDPFRFQGSGVDFKGKLIGERDVNEPRGTEMCNEAMKLVKAAVKSAGAHKQRVVLNISIDGIKIRDEKTGIVVHNFPVAKISFIARDTTDARAFGFVYGTVGGTYKFYGIKTTQTADHAVLSIRDMFQVVFEMKKKQIDEVKQKKEEQENNENRTETEADIRIENGIRMADLIDLESELEQIAAGFNQLQNIPSMPEDSWPTTSVTPDPFQSAAPAPAPTQAPVFAADPFGSSFNPTSNQQPSLFGNGATPAWPQQQIQMTAATNNGFLTTSNNPFAPAAAQHQAAPHLTHHPHSFPVFNPPLNNHHATAVAPQLPADPFDTQGLRQAITSIPQLSSLPLPPPAANNNPFAQVNGFNGNDKKLNIDDLFNELMDTNKLMQKSAPEAQSKNPFEHIINPPKPSIVALAAQNNCAPTIPPHPSHPQLVMPTNRADPFNDDFFN